MPVSLVPMEVSVEDHTLDTLVLTQVLSMVPPSEDPNQDMEVMEVMDTQLTVLMPVMVLLTDTLTTPFKLKF